MACLGGGLRVVLAFIDRLLRCRFFSCDRLIIICPYTDRLLPVKHHQVSLQPRKMCDSAQFLGGRHVQSKAPAGHDFVEVLGRSVVDVVEAVLAGRRPAQHGAEAGRTVHVVQHDRLVVDRDVLENLHRQHPVVARQPVLRQRQVQKTHLQHLHS